MSRVTGNKGLNFTANLSIKEAKKNAEELKAILKDLKIQSTAVGADPKSFSTKPLSEYQAGLLKIKQEALELAQAKAKQLAYDRSLAAELREQAALIKKDAMQQAAIDKEITLAEKKAKAEQIAAERDLQRAQRELAAEQKRLNAELAASEKKQKAEQAAADKAASLATQAALREEARIRREQLAAEKAAKATSGKRVTEFSNSQSEIDAYNKAASGSSIYTSAINAQVVARARNTQQAAVQAVAEGTLRTEQMSATQATKQSTEANKANNLSRADAARLLAEEKYIQAQATKELKNNIREQLNAKGSLEQRRAALIRLNTAYDRLSQAERSTPAGERLKGIIGRTTDQVKGLEAATGRAQRNVGNYTSAFASGASKAWGALKQVANILPGVGIAGLLAFAVEPILDYIKNLEIFQNRLRDIKLTAVDSSEYKEAISSVTSLKTSIDEYHSGQITGKKLVDQYNESIGKTAGILKNTAQVEDFYNSKSADYIKAVMLRAQANAALQASTDKLTEAQSRAISGPSISDYLKAGLTTAQSIGTGGGVAALKGFMGLADVNQKEAIVELNKQGKAGLELFDKLKKESDKFNKQNKFTFDTSTASKAAKAQSEVALNGQRTLQAQIDALTKKGVDKQLSANEEEVESVKAKYKKLTDAAVAYNNAQIEIDRKRAAKGLKPLGLRVDAGGLASAQGKEVDSVINKQAAADLKVTIDEQKKLYDEYENYKTKVGKEKADERYKDLINTDISYLEKLKQLESAQTDPQKSKGGDSSDVATNPFAMKLLGEEIAAAKLAKQKADDEIYAYAFQSALTHSQKLQGIDADYNMKRKALSDAATADQIANLERERQARIQEANEANAYAKGGYDKLMQDFDRLTRGAILKRLQAIKEGYQEEYKAGKLTAEQLANLVSNVNGQIDALNGDNAFKKVTEAIKRYREQVKLLGKDSEGAQDAQDGMYAAIAESAGDINEVMGEIASSLDELGIGGEKTQKAFKDIMGVVDGAGKIAKGLATGNPVDVITGSIKLLTSAISLFNNKDIKLQAKIDAYKAQLASLGTAYEKLDRAVNNSVGESIYTDSAKQIENLRKQQALLIQMRDAEEAKKKTDASKIADYNAQIDAIPGKIEDINKAISENLIQTNFKDLSQSLADALSEAFAAGEDAAGRFDDAFNKVIVNAVKNSLRLKLLEPIINDFTNDLTDYAKKNDNSIIGFDFDKWKKAIEEKGKLYTEGLEAVKDYLPTDASGSTSTDSNLTKNIKQITSEQASALEGIMRGTYDLNKQVVSNTSLLQPIGKSIGDLYQTAVGNLAYSAQIAQNTADTVARLDMAIVELKGINKNTVPTNVRGGGF